MPPLPHPAGSGRVLANLLARGEKADFPMIGKLFSNAWKILPDFSNDWKNFLAAAKDSKSTKIAGGGRKESCRNGEKTASRTGTRLECGFWRQLGQLGTTLSRCAAQPGGERVMDGNAGGSSTERPFPMLEKIFRAFSRDWETVGEAIVSLLEPPRFSQDYRIFCRKVMASSFSLNLP